MATAVRPLADACEECLSDRSMKWPDYCYEPVSIEISDGSAVCRYQCWRHRRTWSTGWLLDALDEDQRAAAMADSAVHVGEVMAKVLNFHGRNGGSK